MEPPKIEDITDLPEQKPHGTSGPSSSTIATESSSDGSPWTLRSTPDPNLLEYSWDPGYGMSSLEVNFMPVNWNSCPSGWNQSFPAEEPRILPVEELPLPPLATLNLGGDAAPAGGGSPDLYDWVMSKAAGLRFE
ncbi:hypothetical protein PGQ11_009764 [Apiospora arundinis]|uniref:Uncharacterized protein n=1 Tax=Apiospora arundinis TaxID=335852 RepID=A0ABR2I7N8_9PEZI